MRLPRLDSATWKALMTALQTFLGFMAALLVLPEFRELVTRFYPQAIPVIVTASGVVTFIINYFRKDVRNY